MAQIQTSEAEDVEAVSLPREEGHQEGGPPHPTEASTVCADGDELDTTHWPIWKIPILVWVEVEVEAAPWTEDAAVVRRTYHSN